MTDRTLKTTGAVRDLIRHLHPDLKRRVRSALAEILDDPHTGKPLKGELAGLWSLRLGRYRIIYRPDAPGAEIIAIGPRSTIYEETTRRTLRRRRSSTRAL